MFGGKEFWVELIGYASIVSVAIFGLIGALSKEWDRRREKAAAEAGTLEATTSKAQSFSWSYFVAIGIILSAVFAMTSNILQDWIDTEKQEKAAKDALAERQMQDSRFNAQLAHLTSLNGQIRTANRASLSLMADMGRSLQSQDRMLTAQDVLLTNARRAMLMTAGLTRQERENTARVLQSMWNDANRIGPNGIELVAQYTCETLPNRPTPDLLRGAAAQLIVADLAQSDDHYSFFGYRQYHSEPRTIGQITGVHVNLFQGFLGENIGAIANPEDWITAGVRIAVVAPLLSSLSEMESLLGPLTPASRNSGIVLPCDGVLILLLNGRVVQSTDVDLVVGGEGVGLDEVAMVSQGHSINSAALPRFDRP